MKFNLFFHRYMTFLGVFFLLGMLSVTTHADTHSLSWSLAGSDSKLAYISIKKNTVGEVNHFTSLSGGISDTGEVAISIDLSSVETNIDIRNQRLIEHVFGGEATKAQLKAEMDLTMLSQLSIGELKTVPVNGRLHFAGKTTDISAKFVVARLTETRLLVVTDEMIIVQTEALGVNKGIDKLMELAALPSITRAVPVSLRMVFDKK